jgi:hypothetical protein
LRRSSTTLYWSTLAAPGHSQKMLNYLSHPTLWPVPSVSGHQLSVCLVPGSKRIMVLVIGMLSARVQAYQGISYRYVYCPGPGVSGYLKLCPAPRVSGFIFTKVPRHERKEIQIMHAFTCGITGMVIISGTNTSDTSLYSHIICTGVLRSSKALLIVDLTKTLHLCLRLRSIVNMGPGHWFSVCLKPRYQGITYQNV